MSRLKFKGDNEEHNFWQNYTDIFAGFLIVFIIASLIAYKGYKDKTDSLNQIAQIVGGNSTGELTGEQIDKINVLVANHELYERVKAFDEAKASFDGKYIKYEPKFKRIEVTVDVPFQSESSVLPMEKRAVLLKAGYELNDILKNFETNKNVSFKIIIDGRAAQGYNLPHPTAKNHQYADTLSYSRARNLYNLWEQNGIISQIEGHNAEVYVSGSGFKGHGRHTRQTDPGHNDPEGINKRFVIQIIPYINFE